MSNNNISREKFKKFLSRITTPHMRIGRTNSFTTAGHTVSYAYIGDTDRPTCRQFHQDATFLITEDDRGEIKYYKKSQLRINALSRIAPDGTKFYNAAVDMLDE